LSSGDASVVMEFRRIMVKLSKSNFSSPDQNVMHVVAAHKRDAMSPVKSNRFVDHEIRRMMP
jgi:hypothetical protein